MNLPIAPHGGQLVCRVVSAEEASAWKSRAAELPQLRLDFRQLTDLYLLGEGAFSPLEGFQDREEVWSVAREFRLRNGLLWSIPRTCVPLSSMRASGPCAQVLLLAMPPHSLQ